MLSLIVPTDRVGKWLPRHAEPLELPFGLEVIIVEAIPSDVFLRLGRVWPELQSVTVLRDLDDEETEFPCQLGLEAATQTYVCFVVSGDSMMSPSLTRMIRALEDSGADIAVIGDRRRRPWPFGSLPGDRRHREIHAYGLLRPNVRLKGTVFRRQFLMDRGIEFSGAADTDDMIFCWRVAAMRPRIIKVDCALTSVRGTALTQVAHRSLSHTAASLARIHREASFLGMRARALALVLIGFEGLWHLARLPRKLRLRCLMFPCASLPEDARLK